MAETAPTPGIVFAQKTNYVEDAAALTIVQLTNKPRFQKILAALIRPLQEIENVIWDLHIQRRLANAVGVNLDVIARIVGENRDGLGDTDFRAIIAAKIRVLQSSGTPDNLLRIVELLVGSLANTRLEETPPAALTIQTDSAPGTARLHVLARFLQRAKVAGVRLDIVRTSSSGIASTFCYSNNAALGTTRGYNRGHYGAFIT
jgi:hypothetical protein